MGSQLRQFLESWNRLELLSNERTVRLLGFLKFNKMHLALYNVHQPMWSGNRISWFERCVCNVSHRLMYLNIRFLAVGPSFRL